VLEDDVTAGLSDAGFRMFVALILLADDYGNVRVSIEWLRGMIWWAHDSEASAEARREIPQVAETLRELALAPLIDVYEVTGQRYAHIRGWAKHQRIDNAGKARVPGPNDNGAKTVSMASRKSRGIPPSNSAARGESPLDPDHRSPIPTATPKGNHASRGALSFDPSVIEWARGAVEEINRISGRSFDPCADGPRKDASVLVKDGFTLEQAFAVFELKSEWLHSDKMRKQYGPTALLRPSNFRRYVEEVKAGPPRALAATAPGRLDEFQIQMERVRMLEEQEKSQ
jgi:hypothetical protein